MKLQLTEKPTIDIRDDSAIVIFPSRPYWFAASEGIKIILDILEKEISREEATECIVEKLDVSYGEAVETLDEVQELLFSNGVLVIDGKLSNETKMIEPDFQVHEVERVLVIATTQKCNLTCLHCYANAKESLPNELDTDDLKGLVDDLARMPWKNEISSVGLTGGEFFTRKDAIEIIRYVSEKGFRVLISSNSLLLTDGDISFLAGLPNLKISISLDGPVAEIHEEIRGPGTYERTVKNIRKLTTAGVFVGVNMFVHDRNLESIEDTLLLADSLGVKAFNCINLLYVGRANTELSRKALARVPESVLYHRLFNILRHNARYQEMMQNSTFANQIMGISGGVKSHYCGIGTNRALYVRADGNIYPCPHTELKDFLLGNIRTGSLKTIWEESPILRKLRLLDVDKMNLKCSSCDVRYTCGGSCRGENYQVTQDFLSPHFNCEEIRKTILDMIWMLVEQPDLFQIKVRDLYQSIEC